MIREFEIAIEAGQYFRVTAVPAQDHGVGMELSRSGKKIAGASSLGGSGGTASLAAVADQPTTYLLKIRTRASDSSAHEVRLSIEDHAAQARDRADADAFAALAVAKSASDFLAVRDAAISAGDQPLAAQAFLSTGWAYLSSGEYAKGAEFVKSSLAQPALDRRAQGEAWYLAGLFGIYQEQHQSAIDAFQHALAVQRELHQQSELASTLHNLSCAQFLLAKCKEAIPPVEEALTIRRALHEPSHEAFSLFALAKDRGCLGDAQGALEDYQTVLPLWRSLKDVRNEAATFNDMGVIHASLGDSERATSFYKSAMSLREKAGDADGRIESLVNLGQLMNWTGNHKAALDDFKQALAILETHDSKRARGYVLEGLGESLLRLGMRADAIAKLREAIDDLHQSGDRKGEAYVWEMLAEAEASVESANRALVIFREVGDTVGQTLTLPKLARIERDRGDLAAARGSLEEAIQIIESSRDAVHDPSLRMAYLAAKRDAYDLYVDVLTRLDREHSDPALQRAAFEASERSHARSLLDELSGGGDTRIATLDEIRAQALDSDTVLLEVLLGVDRSSAWVVARDSFQRVDLPSRDVLESAARRLYESLTARNRHDSSETPEARAARLSAAGAETERAAADLKKMLIDPLQARIAHRRVLIVADGFLHLIPFELLGIDAEIVCLPSASVLVAMRHGSKQVAFGKGPILVLADPVFSPADGRVSKHAAIEKGGDEFPRLIDSRKEADAIVAAAGANRVHQALDFDASPAQLSTTFASRAETIHIAAHAVVNTRNSESSGIMLSMADRNGNPVNGFLSLRRIYQLQLHAGLVTLSACDTAVGKDVRGEGLIAISRAFLFAGATRVLATLWKVDDDATAEFMRRFYRHLYADNQHPAAALHLTQAEMRAESRWRSPFYWAAFTLQGDWK